MSTKYIASNWRLLNKAGVESYKSDNYGLTFDGSSEYINCGTPSTFAFGTNDFSISGWVYLDTSSGYQWLFSTGTNFAFGFDSSRNLQLWVGGTATTPTFNINLNQWHHVVATRNSGTVTFYIDGVAHGTTYTRTGSISAGAYNYIGTFNIGQNHIDGSISQLSIFDYALSSTQISTLYGSSSLGAGNPMALKPQPVAYYPLGDNSASNPLTQPNEAVEDASVFEFDGSSSYVSTTITQSGTLSVSCWFYTDDASTQMAFFGAGTTYPYQIRNFGLQNGEYVVGVYTKDLTPNFQGIRYDTTAGSASYTTGQWTHFVGIIEKVTSTNANYYLYENGVLKVQTNDGYREQTTYPFFLGSHNNFGNATQKFNGKMSNIQLWSSKLEASEVTTLYNSGVPLLTGTQPQASSLRSWYKLDQSANWEADSSGAWQIPDAVSAYPQSFDFGTRSQTEYIALNQLPLYNAITVSAWIKTQKNGSSGQTIISNSQSNAIANEKGWQLAIDQAWSSGFTKAGFVFYDSTGSTAITIAQTSSQELTDNNWHHVVALWDGTTNTNAAKIFVDGLLAGQGTSSFTGPINQPVIGLEPRIGTQAYSTSGGGKNFGGDSGEDGFISNVQTWDSSLTYGSISSIGDVAGGQIAELYNNGVPLTTAIASDNLKAWYKLDNTATFSTNWSIPDASGNGNTGTSSGMTEQNLVNNNVSALNGESSGMTSASLVLSDLTRAVPYDSYSFNFDSASSDYIPLPTITEVNSATACTLSYWGKKTASNKYLVFGSQIGLQDGIWLTWWSDGNVYFSPRNGANSGASYALSFDTNWHHFVGVYDGSSANIYIDGNLVSTSTTSIPSSLSATAGTDFNIGLLQSQYTDGKMSNLSIFDQALTSTQVMKLYSNGVPQDLTNFNPQPVAFYTLGSNSFWNGSNWICRDLIGSNSGTSANAGVDAIVGDAPRSEANGTGTNMDVPTNLEGTTKWSDSNSWSINMSESARVEDTP